VPPPPPSLSRKPILTHNSIWRPLKQVTSYPLAVCDTNSVSPQDLIPKERIGKRYTGESFLARYSEGHKWYFLGGQRVDEVLAMKIFDSEERGGASCEFKFLSVLGVGRNVGKFGGGVVGWLADCTSLLAF
jgi:hypothetical protein